MRRFFQPVLLATFLFPGVRVFGQAIVAVEENGHRVYVNDVAAAPEAGKSKAPSYRLVYWSQVERRWKAVPGAQTQKGRAARSAAAEVQEYLGLSGVGVRRLQDPRTKPGQTGAAKDAETAATSAKPAVDLDAVIQEAATKHNVDPNLVRAIVKVESNNNPAAVSRKGAMGLMQLMPGTARELAVRNPFDPEQNVDAGVRHLRSLLENFGGDVPKSLAAYNAGAKAVERNKGIPPYAETRDYVRRITRLYGDGAPLGNFQLGPQIHVTRGPDGVLNISNTD